jgi:hypothetical protein
VAIELGSSVELNFSTPVKIVIGGMTGKKAAWSRGSATLIDISTQCNNATDYSNLNSTGGSPRECYSDDGTDLIIWTYHFTTFAAYLALAGTTTPATTEGGGGGGTIVYVISDADFEKGYTKDVKINEKLQVKINDEEHSISVTSLTASTATIKVESTPQQAVLAIGDEKKFEVTGDNYYDIYVKLNNITSSKASITIKKISELIPSVSPVTNETETKPEAEKGAEEKVKTAPVVPLLLWIISAVVIMGIIIVLIVKGKKVKGKKK